MSHPIVPSQLQSRVKRRRALPLATAAAASIGLAGCNMLPAAPAAAPVNPEQRVADQRVRAFTSDVEIALDSVDRNRLRAAAEKKNQPVVAPPISPTVSPTVSPAVVSAPIAAPAAPVAPASPPASTETRTPTSQAPVLLASSAEPSAPASEHKAAPASHEKAETPEAAKPPAPESPHAAAAPREATPAAPALAAAPAAPVAHVPSAAPAAAAILPPVAPEAGEMTESHAAPAIASAAPTAAGANLPTGPVPVATIAPPSPQVQAPVSAMGAMTAMISPPGEGSVALVSAAAPSAAAAPEPSVEEALSVLRRKIEAHPTVATALALALLETGEGKSGEAEISKKLPDTDQKVLTDLVAALSSMQTPAGSGATLSDRAAPLLDAAKKWQADADLALPRLVLATRVDSFGVYTAIEPKFEQGKRHTVIIYCEVANFASKKGDDGWYATHLAQQETLITDDGLLVWRPNAEDVEDRSLNQRHDFYLVKKLTIPENLAAGKYTLRMSVTDRTTNKISMMSIPVEITAK